MVLSVGYLNVFGLYLSYPKCSFNAPRGYCGVKVSQANAVSRRAQRIGASLATAQSTPHPERQSARLKAVSGEWEGRSLSAWKTHDICHI
eukprot:2762957-Amphidinium_carterae.1